MRQSVNYDCVVKIYNVDRQTSTCEERERKRECEERERDEKGRGNNYRISLNISLGVYFLQDPIDPGVKTRPAGPELLVHVYHGN